MRPIIRILVTCLLLIGLLPTAPAQSLVISTNNTPLDRKALELLSQEAFQRAGRGVTVVNNPSERSLRLANQGQVDGEGLRVADLSKQYPDLLQIPERFVGISFVAFARDALISTDHGWDSLKQHRVAFITGWKLFEANAAGAKSVTKVDTPEQMFRMLDSGRVDLALYTRADGIALVRSLKMPAIAPLTPSLRDVSMYLYLHRRHEALVPRIAQALREMKSDGSYNRILATVGAE